LPLFFQNFQQHDCSEFAKIFLDQLEKEIKKEKLRNIVNDYFQGSLVQEIK